MNLVNNMSSTHRKQKDVGAKGTRQQKFKTWPSIIPPPARLQFLEVPWPSRKALEIKYSDTWDYGRHLPFKPQHSAPAPPPQDTWLSHDTKFLLTSKVPIVFNSPNSIQVSKVSSGTQGNLFLTMVSYKIKSKSPTSNIQSTHSHSRSGVETWWWTIRLEQDQS